jgi:hypothetical protein
MVSEAVIVSDNGTLVKKYSLVFGRNNFEKIIASIKNSPPEFFPNIVVKGEKKIYLNDTKWNIVGKRAYRKERILLYRNKEGVINPLLIKKEVPDNEGFASEALNSDLFRGFGKSVKETKIIATNKWVKLGKVVLTALLVILGLGAAVVAIVLVSKVSTDQLGIIKGTVDTASNSFLNATSRILGG